jgi:hypothetical protein
MESARLSGPKAPSATGSYGTQLTVGGSCEAPRFLHSLCETLTRLASAIGTFLNLRFVELGLTPETRLPSTSDSTKPDPPGEVCEAGSRTREPSPKTTLPFRDSTRAVPTGRARSAVRSKQHPREFETGRGLTVSQLSDVRARFSRSCVLIMPPVELSTGP